jgi:tetratricopeptide (TPR) repeat protein
MKSKLTIGIVSSMLLTFLTPTSIKAQASGDIGTNRKQQSCPSRKEPRTGVISVAQAIKYATCEAEADRIVKNPGMTDFLDIFSLQVNPKPRRAAYADIYYFGDAITNSMVYEIKGSAVAYSCTAVDSFPSSRRGKNCLTTNEQDRGPNNSAGVCVRFPSGDWRCNLGVGGANNSQYGPPPSSANASGSSKPQIATNNGEAYIEQAWLKKSKKDYQGALADFNLAIQTNPNNTEFYSYRAWFKQERKDYQGALADFNLAIQINPSDANLYNRRALLKFDIKDYQGAFVDSNRAIQINPSGASLYAERGRMKARLKLKDRSSVIKDWEQAAKLYQQQGNTTSYEAMLSLIRDIDRIYRYF